ncbi:MAG TPA: PilZ domain-containing protein [Nitrospirota bacterium]|nr:PilZ domain-containing protein [Nitrospirota bacterium]
MSEKKSVLIICRTPAGQMYLGVLLKRIWYSPILAKTAEEGVRLAQNTRFSLIIYDGDVTGLEQRASIMLLRSDAAVKDLPLVVFLTSENTPADDSLLSLGCTAVLTKPLDLSIVYGVLGRLTGEQRHAPRIPAKFIVEIREGTPEARLMCVDLSEGGLYLRSHESLPEGAVIHVRFTLPRDTVVMELTARVARVIPLGTQIDAEPGIGLEFVDAPEDSRLRIRNFVQWEMTGDLEWKADI